jgi:hypothetical protein
MFKVIQASEKHSKYAHDICEEMANSAKARGTGIAKRSPEYLIKKMQEGKAVIALDENDEWAGFCYIEAWEHEKYVANSGLIVNPKFRKSGLAKRIKKQIFKLSRQRYPKAKIFGLTTGLAVMKINSELGYVPVTYSELTLDEEFWKGCQSCVNFEILQSKGRSNCMCTAMLFTPPEDIFTKITKDREVLRDARRKSRSVIQKIRVFERIIKIKESIYLKLKSNKSNNEKK